MKNDKKTRAQSQEMAREYDLSGKKGVRGKYYRAYRQGHTVRITQQDGTVQENYFTLQDGAVMLEPDVRQYFPDSQSVNTALRSLIALIPSNHTRKRKPNAS